MFFVFFPEAETILLPGVLFSLASASPTSWDFDDQLELSKRSMPQVDLFVCCFSIIKRRSDSFQPTVRWKISPRSPMTIFCHQAWNLISSGVRKWTVFTFWQQIIVAHSQIHKMLFTPIKQIMWQFKLCGNHLVNMLGLVCGNFGGQGAFDA